jgi:hypothetical protein
VVGKNFVLFHFQELLPESGEALKL